MTVAEPSTTGQRLAFLLECAGKRSSDVVDDMIIDDLTSLEDIIADRRSVTTDEALVLAAYLDVPIGVLTGHIPAGGRRGLAMRLGQSDQSRDIRGPLTYAHTMLRIQQLLRAWIPDAENMQLTNASKVRSNHSHYKQAGKITAERLRSILDLGHEPIADLTALVEDLGVPVAHRPMEPDSNLTGLTVPDQFDDRQRWGIVINSDENWLRQRYTLSHELCHVLYGDSDDVIVERVESVDQEPEWRADSFARHLLVPEEGLRKFYEKNRPWAIGDTKSEAGLISGAIIHFGASRQVVLRALVADDYFTKEQAEMWENVSVREIMASVGKPDWWESVLEREGYFEPSPMLLNLALNAYSEGLVDVRIVAELLEDDPETVRAELAERGWLPAMSRQ